VEKAQQQKAGVSTVCYTVIQAAEMCGVDHSVIRAKIRSGELKAFDTNRNGKRNQWRIRAKDLAAWQLPDN